MSNSVSSHSQSPRPASRYAEVEDAAGLLGLQVYGALRPDRQKVKQLSSGTLLLLGTGGEFWSHFLQSPEFADQAPDPIDRWSSREIGALAKRLGAQAYFPFGGPPYTPFVSWALSSGRAFTSPSQMLVHDTVGMMISFRGALHFDQGFDIPPPLLAHSPCVTCATKPCLNTCPAHAMIEGGPYDLTACHSHLDTPAGKPCMSQGCLARRACPLSRGAERSYDQTAHHMRYFHRS